MKFNPKQMIPAYNWFAVFRINEGGEEQAYIRPLVCWALGTLEKVSEIHGMVTDDDGEVISAKSCADFLGYEFDNDNSLHIDVSDDDEEMKEDLN